MRIITQWTTQRSQGKRYIYHFVRYWRRHEKRVKSNVLPMTYFTDLDIFDTSCATFLDGNILELTNKLSCRSAQRYLKRVGFLEFDSVIVKIEYCEIECEWKAIENVLLRDTFIEIKSWSGGVVAIELSSTVNELVFHFQNVFFLLFAQNITAPKQCSRLIGCTLVKCVVFNYKRRA